ncbi:MAG: ABC transporter permease [Planctomycetota bacterium]|jgi:phospholipid/cholesterol/gamma-HCH transport system permease protein|nr:ABC transporter permease [Planctomycetota bacterium]
MILLRPFEAIGSQILDTAFKAGYSLTLFLRSVACLGGIFEKRKSIASQLYICGVQSVGITLVVALFTGMILALQTGLVLQRYNIEGFLGTVILVTLCREMGPFMCAFILAGRVGSAMAAEIGTMNVSEEVDALRVMSIDPVRFLVMPRIISLVIFAPVLTVFTNFVGVLGGSIVANLQIGVEYSVYFGKIFEYLEDPKTTLEIFYGGLFKSAVFGCTIAVIGCSNGLRTSQGAVGVGKASRKAVVDSFLFILMLNYFMSSVINRFFY